MKNISLINEPFQIGEIYTTRMEFLCPNVLYHFDDEITDYNKINSREDYDEVYEKLKENNVDDNNFCKGFDRQIESVVPKKYHWVPVFMEYLGNGKFRELITHVKINLFSDAGQRFGEFNINALFDTYTDAIPTLNEVYNSPLSIVSSEDYYIRPVRRVDLVEYQKLSIDEMGVIIVRAVREARSLFVESLEKYISVDYEAAKTEDFIREYKKR